MKFRIALLLLIACLAIAVVIAWGSGQNAIDQAIEQALKAKTYGKAFLILEDALEEHGDAPNANDARLLLRQYKEEQDQAKRGMVRVGSRWIDKDEAIGLCEAVSTNP